jgi:error-prone DNA polymerase
LGDLDLRAGGLALAQPGAGEAAGEASAGTPALPALGAPEQTAWEYELMGASPAGQMMRHRRATLQAAGVLTCAQVRRAAAGRKVRCAGFVVVRQRPATAKGILFLSLEDESGLLDVVVKPPVYARLRDLLAGQPLIVVEGVVQRSGRAASLLLLDAAALGAG